jgi:hypothetical protein
MPSWALMWALAGSLFFGLKALTLWRARKTSRYSLWRPVAYVFAWPGMDPQSFLNVGKAVAPPGLREWLWATFDVGLGVVLFWGVSRVLPASQPLLRGWTGMVGLILLLHFGVFQLLALVWQQAGIDAAPIMSSPLSSRSLGEFWGKRWNLGFSRPAYDLIFTPLRKLLGAAAAGLVVFVVSGLVHDLVISVPAEGGYGLPTGYFVLQGLGILVERSSLGKRLGLRKGIRGWSFMVVCTAGPLFWLFHPPFVLHVIIPFMKATRAL